MAPILSRLTFGGGGGFGFGKKQQGGGGGVFTLTGGTIIPAATSGDGYTYNVFIGADDWSNTSGFAGTVEILLVAGGASGGLSGGGGGAGGVAFASAFPIGASDVGPYPISVGAGGGAVPYPSPDHRGISGSATVFTFNGGSYPVFGGGAGGKGNTGPGPSNDATPGGSGGGVGRDNPAGSAGGVNPAPTNPLFTRYGQPGGSAPSTGGSSGGGGGGGALEAGKNNQPSSYGTGGHGMLIPAFPAQIIAPTIPSPVRTSFTNAVRYYGAYGGGGGGGGYSYPGNSGGNGGGGWGDAGNLGGSGPSVAQPGCDYTGGGGGGSGGSNGGVPGNSGKGGDGLAIIRYTTNTTRATGGFISYIAGKTVHAFTRGSGFTTFVNPAPLTVDVIAVGGGGAGGPGSGSAGSGGGGGGVYYRTGYSLPATTHPVSVGAGGDGGAGNASTFSPGTIAASANGGNAGAVGPGSTGASSGGYPSNGNASFGPYLFSAGAGGSGSGNSGGGGGGAGGNGIDSNGDCGTYAGRGGTGKTFTNVAVGPGSFTVYLGSGGGGGSRCAPGATNISGSGGDSNDPAPTTGTWDITTWARPQGGPGGQEPYSAGYGPGPGGAVRGLARYGQWGLPGTGSGGGGTHEYTAEYKNGGRGGDGIIYVLYDT